MGKKRIVKQKMALNPKTNRQWLPFPKKVDTGILFVESTFNNTNSS